MRGCVNSDALHFHEINNRPITRNAPRVSNKATKSRDKQCVTTILVNNSSHGDPRLPPSVSETIAGSQVNDQRMETQNNRYYNDNTTTLTARGIIVTKEFCEYFCIFSRQEMSWWWRRVTTESYRSHKNIPTPATFLAPATFYSDFIRRPNILNWGPSFQTVRRDVAVSKSYRERDGGRGLSRQYSLKTVHLKYFASRGPPSESFPGLYFT